MKFYVGSDHAGFAVKGLVIEMLKSRGHDVIDMGPENAERVDYPDYAEKVSRAVVSDEGSFGILICGTGIGMSIAANKIDGIRAAHCNATIPRRWRGPTTTPTSSASASGFRARA